MPIRRYPRRKTDIVSLVWCRCTRLGLLVLLLATTPTAGADMSIALGSAVGLQNAGAASGGSVDQGEWSYTLRPGDSVLSLSKDMLDNHHTWLQLLRHNNIGSASDLHPGSVLHIPLDWLRQRPEPAHAVAVTGQVFYQDLSGRGYQPLSRGTRLDVGDEVRTDNGHVVIQLADQSIVRLGPRSSLTFNRLTRFGKTGMADTRMRLEQGNLSTKVHPLSDPRSRFEIETPSAVAAVRGTQFRLNAMPDGTRLEVTKGKVAFSNDYHQALVPAGKAALISGINPIEISDLPQAPKPPASPGKVQKLPQTLKWQAVPAATGYHLDIYNRNNGAWIASTHLDKPAYQLTGLDNGQYAALLSAVDTNGVQGNAKPVDFSIDLQAHAADLLAPAADGKIDNKRPLFKWKFQGNDEKARVQVSTTQDFQQILTSSNWNTASQASVPQALDPGQYYWRVQTRAGGDSQAQSAGRSLLILGSLPETHIITINYVDNQVRIFWEKIPQVRDYRLQLASDPAFTNILREETLQDTSVAARLVPGQHYFVRIKGVPEGPLGSHWGPGRELYVK